MTTTLKSTRALCPACGLPELHFFSSTAMARASEGGLRAMNENDPSAMCFACEWVGDPDRVAAANTYI